MKKVKVLLIILAFVLISIFAINNYVIAEEEIISLKAQKTRPFNDDDYDGKIGNDTYRFIRRIRIW